MDQQTPMPDPQNPQRQQVMIPDNPYSGNVILYFFYDDLEVWADFIPPVGAGAPLTWESLQDFLKQLNIVYGLQEAAIQQAILTCDLTKQPLKQILLAKGDPPVHEVADYFQLDPRLSAPPPASASHDRIDYHSYSPFIIVKRDQVLAKLQPGTAGKAGKNVYGGVIPYKVIRPAGVVGGNHTKTGEKGIAAEISGQFIQKQNLLEVQETLTIKGGVGYATGNIVFPGDVIIDGPVSDGFKIYADGSVTIKQTFDVTEVVARGDLQVAGGIIGRNQALVKVRGAIKTKFIENCHVACRKTLRVERGILNSTVFAMEQIDLGDKGFIIGGDMTAIHGIRAGGIGKPGGKSTKLHCGIDFTIQQEQEKTTSRFQFLSARIEQIQKLMALERDHEKWVNLETLLRRNQEELAEVGIRLSALLERTNADEKAVVEVYGEIAPGTLIEICHIALFLTAPLRRVRIKLDKFYGKLISEPL